MKTEEIGAFIKVAQLGSFSRASEELYISQPTISRYVANLENELGGSLLIRHARNCELTQLGEKVLPRMLRVQYEAKRILEDAESVRDCSRKALSIGYTYEGMLPHISDALERGGLLFSALDVNLRFDVGSMLAEMLRNKRIDCAIMHLPSLNNPKDLDIHLIKKARMGLVVSETHPLARQKQVKLKQVCEETQVRYSVDKAFYEAADKVFYQTGLEPMKIVDTDSQHEGVVLVRHKGCVALNPTMYPVWSGCRVLEIEDWFADCSLVFVTRKGELSGLLEVFFEKVRCAVRADNT